MFHLSATAVDLFQVYETPFYVAVDHDKKKVVISIRGTLSPKVSALRPHLPLAALANFQDSLRPS